ncbi:acyl-CoA Delta(11) desaturase isoform X1 [Pieris rapae]|uniref:acyl-CoA Delta(11) desaturase isoform X1 n=2 Tax=Pieris rapae TaxID=64459 RepID=UPI001E27CE2F|nr:acyl-CoA Delta(11) desaturase isoform X1 [Pieris rapae]
MAPNTSNDVIEVECMDAEESKLEKLVGPQARPWKYEIIYGRVAVFGYFHLAALYGLYLALTAGPAWSTIIFHCVVFFFASIGVYFGLHRLWCHNALKAKLPLQILMVFLASLTFQFSALNWIRDHRLHHKYTDTDADPHNAARGLFFSHIGWLLVKKHPEVKRRGKFIDLRDVKANPILRFQHKWTVPFIGSICFVIPTLIPMYFWNETLNMAWHLTFLRFVASLHQVFLVNSYAHFVGTRPYDKHILPADNRSLNYVIMGEGFHNFHHAFPWDYRSAELGSLFFNPSTWIIELFAKIGWAYDLKTASESVIEGRAQRTGDGTRVQNKSNLNVNS